MDVAKDERPLVIRLVVKDVTELPCRQASREATVGKMDLDLRSRRLCP